MARTDKKRKRLEEQLVRLTQNEGVRRINLYKFLGSDLCDVWEITDCDSPELMVAKVSRQLCKLIARLNREAHRDIAEICFNVRDDPNINELWLCAREDNLAQAHQVTRRTIFNRLRDEIIPALVHMMLTDQVRTSDDAPRA
jgi:hypothetical protein